MLTSDSSSNFSTMTYTYTWTTTEKESLQREDEDGNVCCVPVAEQNSDYQEFLASGAVAADPPGPPPEPPTTEQKVDAMLEAFGLTHEEFMAYQASTVKSAVAAKADATTQEVPES